MTTTTECDLCAAVGQHDVPATTRSRNPDWSGYRLCAECAREYDSREGLYYIDREELTDADATWLEDED